MANPVKLAQFKLPGGSSGPVEFAAPSGVPEHLRGNLENSGTAFFQTVVNNLFILGSFLTLVMVIISGIQWITSRGDPEKVASAKRRFYFAMIGLIVMLSAFFIVRVIVFITGGNWEDFVNPSKLLQENQTN
jgi:hypothetical protein